MDKIFLLLLIIPIVLYSGCITDNITKNEARFGDLSITIEISKFEFMKNISDNIEIATIIKNISNDTVKISKHYFDEVSIYIEDLKDKFEQPKSTDDYNKDSYFNLDPNEEKRTTSSISLNGNFYSNNNEEFILGLQPGNYTIYATYSYDGGKIISNELGFKII